MTEQHAPVERLAAYAAGDLDAPTALEVETHVLLCADCRSDVAALQRVSAALAEVEQVPMPADVAARVDAALAAERAGDGATVAATAAGPGGALGPGADVLPMVAPRRRRPSFAGIAAVAAGLALFGAISVPFLTKGDEPVAEQATSGAATTTKRFASGLDYRADDPEVALRRALSGAHAPSAPMAEAPNVSRDSAEGVAGYEGTSTAAPAVKSGMPRLSLTSEYTALRTEPARLASCLTALSVEVPDEARKPLVVDFATFEGRPALIVVFPTYSKGRITTDRVDFWAVGPRCGITPGDDDVLHFARFRRPPGL